MGNASLLTLHGYVVGMDVLPHTWQTRESKRDDLAIVYTTWQSQESLEHVEADV